MQRKLNASGCAKPRQPTQESAWTATPVWGKHTREDKTFKTIRWYVAVSLLSAHVANESVALALDL